MTSKIRVFVSSTMKDLVNERDAVVQKVKDFNFEPVNAESWLPNGSKSWNKIEKELQSSHLFLLLLGERYGWIPDHGPGAEKGLSVTHMEFNAAQQAKIPVLPFVKKLDYESPRGTKDARKRDEFRNEVGRWDTGHFLSEFELASDLGIKIGASLVGVLSESYLRTEVTKRVRTATPIFDDPAKREPLSPALDLDLASAVRNRQAILLAGAGMSLTAGLPSPLALTELLISRIGEDRDNVSASSMSHGFHEIAWQFEMEYGRAALIGLFQEALQTPQVARSNESHMLSVQLFETVLTTNVDCLFESACNKLGLDHYVITGDVPVPEEDDRVTIIKLNGTIAEPDTLILTDRGYLGTQSSKPILWQSLVSLMNRRSLVVVGHSVLNVQDIRMHALLDNSGKDLHRYFVAPKIDSLSNERFKGWGFKTVESDAVRFLKDLRAVVDVRG